MSLRNLQYQSSDRGSDIVFLRKLLIKFLVVVLVTSFVLFPLFQASPSFSQSNSVVINELFYDLTVPADKPTECTTSNYFEWLELKNISSAKIDLSNWVVQDNKSQDPLSGVLEPEKLLIIAARESCFRALYPNFSGNLVDLDSYIGNGLGNNGDVVILLEGGVKRDRREYQAGAASKDMSFAGDASGVWKEANPTPGAKNTFPEEETKEEEEAEEQQEEKQQPQPATSFSSPSTVSVGTSFSVSVTLKDFKAGTYFLKVLIGKGDKFIYGNTKGAGGWLTQNGKWAEMPRVTIGSSGSKTIQAKTDDDVAAGGYLIKGRVYDGKDTFDSDTKSLTVTGSAKPGGSAGTQGSSKSAGDESGGPSFAEATEGGAGEVKGEEAPRGEGSKLNFYIILGIFGVFVGSGGLIFAFRRGARRPRTPGTPESEQDLP